MANPFVRFGRSSPVGGATVVLALTLFLAQAAAADVNRADRDRSKGKRGGNAELQQAIDFELINVNNVLSIFDNRGILLQDPRTGNGFGFFPANSPNNYTFGSGLWVGGLVNGTAIVSTGYDASGGFSEYLAGRSAANGGGADQILCSNNASDLAQWYPEFSDASGNPLVFSQKDCVVIYNDANQARDVSTPIGLEVRHRTMAFTFGLLSSVFFVVWDVENTGANTLEEAFVAVNADMDIGSAFDDDNCSAVPFVPPGPNNSSADTAFTNLGICWDSDFNEADFDPNPPGFVGITFFQGPVSEAGDTLGLTRFTLTTNPTSGRPQPDPSTDAAQYDLLRGAGTRAPFIDATPADVRIVQISGPITFAPGQTQRVVAGYLWANVASGASDLSQDPTRCFPAGSPCFLPDPQDPALEEVIRVQRAAQVIFDAAFLSPAPPPKPDMTLIPGDGQVTIVSDFTNVLTAPDPFFGIASDPTNPAFDPLFREFDFEGFVIVRSTSGNPADVDTIAIFDLANDVVAIEDTTTQIFTVGDSVVELVTDVQPILSDLPNQGLQFAFTDRGLINGIVYFYDVVPFDFNPSNTLRGPDISLSAGISFQPSAVRSVRPRTNATSFEFANARFEALRTDGTVCDEEETAATIDSVTGKYVDFIDCSNAIFDVQLTPARDVAIPSGEFFFVIDSILPSPNSNPYDPAAGYALAFGFNQVWFHWEDASGNPATNIQPTVGFFEQTFDFTHAASVPVGFALDTNPTDIGADLGGALIVGSAFSTFEDLEVNGRSVHLGELGGTAHLERRPHRVDGSSLADVVWLGNARQFANAREYSHPGPYSQGATSYQLTWSVEGGGYSGTLTKLPGGEIVPQGGQPKGPENPSTPADFIAGYNWGFVGPGDAATVANTVFPLAGPLTNTISLNVGDSFSVVVPGQSVLIEGIQDLPDDGDTWTFLIDSGSDRASSGGCAGGFFSAGRQPCDPTAPFSYNDSPETGGLPGFERAVVNVYPGARWRLTTFGGSNDPLEASLANIKTVPNPYLANAVWDFSQDNQRLEFTNLPPECTIRIYTISGNLVRVIEHTNGSGTEVWDLRTRFNLKAASGTYYWHVTTPDGRTALGLMSIIQNATGAS